jgi:hypothetical protein
MAGHPFLKLEKTTGTTRHNGIGPIITEPPNSSLQNLHGYIKVRQVKTASVPATPAGTTLFHQFHARQGLEHLPWSHGIALANPQVARLMVRHPAYIVVTKSPQTGMLLEKPPETQVFHQKSHGIPVFGPQGLCFGPPGIVIWEKALQAAQMGSARGAQCQHNLRHRRFQCLHILYRQGPRTFHISRDKGWQSTAHLIPRRDDPNAQLLQQPYKGPGGLREEVVGAASHEKNHLPS